MIDEIFGGFSLPGLSLEMLRKTIVFQVSLVDQVVIGLGGQKPVPPVELRWRVHGNFDVPTFIQVGEQCARDITAAILREGRRIEDFEEILDFGCGCGRILMPLRRLAPHARFFGSDIDPEAIEWCARNLHWGTFAVNRYEPPLPFAEDQFDLVCSISVFTHLRPESQFLWLEELQRVTRPGGIVLLTVHGYHCWKSLSPDAIRKMQQEGIAVIDMEDPFMKLFSAHYSNNTFHSREYVQKEFERYFRILAYLPLAMNRHQDVVLLQKREERLATPEAAS
jgi:SAM-dependent methyltransferase